MLIHRHRIVQFSLALFCLLNLALGCDHEPKAQTDAQNESTVVALTDWNIERIFPVDKDSTVNFEGCLYTSPFEYQRAEATEIIIIDATGELAGLDPDTGTKLWSLRLSAPDGEKVMVIAQPAFIDSDRLLFAYHSVPESLDSIEAASPRTGQYMTVVDLATRAIDPNFGVVEMEATVPSNEGGSVQFRPSNALVRPDLVIGKLPNDHFGKAYITSGNARDIQPWHGWAFEVDLDRWHEEGGERSISSVFLVTPEEDQNCGDAGSSGSLKRMCGGGLWAPSGPLILDKDQEYEIILASGNGQLDLARQDYANTIMRLSPGLEFDPQCDQVACANFNSDAPSFACVESCSNLWIPRLTGQDDDPPNPWDGRCDGLGLFECWQKLDYIGGSTPVYLEFGTHKTLSYPTKDGHLYLIDETHLGRQFDRHKLVEQCGAEGDPCKWGWAGMAVTEPLVVQREAGPVIMTATFMPDQTHPAGVVAVTLEDGENGPQYRRLWEFPPFDQPDARTRFRVHPTRMALGSLGNSDRALAWIVEVNGSGGRLIALDVDDGSRVFESKMIGPGYRFTVPFVTQNRVYVSSCKGNAGPGHVEAFEITERIIGGENLEAP